MPLTCPQSPVNHLVGRTRARLAWPSWPWSAVSREIVADCLAFLAALAPAIDRLDAELRQHAKADPRARVLTDCPASGSSPR
jgi:hypothetical protein